MKRVFFFLVFLVIVRGQYSRIYNGAYFYSPAGTYYRDDPGVCMDLPIDVTNDDDTTKYLFYKRQFGTYVDKDNAQHLLWGGGGASVMYDIMIDETSGINFTMTEVDIPFNSTMPSGFGIDIIEIHDVDKDGVNDLIVVSLESSTSSPLTVLYRNETGITGTFNIFLGDLVFEDVYKWASLDYYSGDSDETTFLFSIGGSVCGAWIISFSNEEYQAKYWELALPSCGDEYGVSIARWIDFGDDGYDDIVVSSPQASDDGQLSIYYIIKIEGDGLSPLSHNITYDTDFINYNNDDGDANSGLGNSISTIYEIGDTIPRLAIGSQLQNYFLILVANNNSNMINNDFVVYHYEDFSGFGKSVTQVKNYDIGGSIGEIVIAYDDKVCLYYLDDIIDVSTTGYSTTGSTTGYSTTGVTTGVTTGFTTSFSTTGSTTSYSTTSATTGSIGYSTTTPTTVTTTGNFVESESIEYVESNTEKTEEEICTIIQGICTDGGVVITPPTNTSNGVNITDDVTINQNTTIKGSNVTVTGSITITGSLDIDSSSLDIKNKIDVSGDLNVGNSVLVFSNNGGTIKAGGCVTFASDSEIKIELTDEEKKQLAKNGEGFVLIESDCFEGEEKFTDASSSCENGVRESIKVNEDSMSVIFENCLEPGWIVFIILLIVGAVVVFLLLVLFTPLRTKIFPHRRENQEKDGTVRDNRVISRLTLMDTELKGLSRRTMHLKGELDSLSSYDSN